MSLQEVKPEVVKEEEAPKETYKADDFFDSLSCEALERLAVSEGAAPEKPQVRKVFHCICLRIYNVIIIRITRSCQEARCVLQTSCSISYAQ